MVLRWTQGQAVDARSAHGVTVDDKHMVCQWTVSTWYFAEMCSGSEEGSYLRRVDVASLNSRLESNKDEAE